jgi:hypothetical protein
VSAGLPSLQIACAALLLTSYFSPHDDGGHAAIYADHTERAEYFVLVASCLDDAVKNYIEENTAPIARSICCGAPD